MKLSDITFKQSKEFELLDPVTKKSFTPKVTLEILSGESKEAKNNLLKAQRKIYELMQDESNKEDGKLKPEIIENVNKVYLSSLIVSWKNIEDAKKVTDEAKLKLIENDYILSFIMEHSSDLGKYRLTA
jgi:hypothetical protein